jgi:hypothetical protein
MLTQYTNPPMLVVAKTVLFLTSLAFSLSRSPKTPEVTFQEKIAMVFLYRFLLNITAPRPSSGSQAGNLISKNCQA